MSILNLDELLDGTMDNVSAAPEYVDPTPGVHAFRLTKLDMAKREAKDKQKAVENGNPTEWPEVVLTYTLVSTLESEGLPPKPGSLSTDRFQFTDKGKPHFKTRMLAILSVLGITEEEYNGLSMREQIALVEEAQPVFVATVAERKYTDNSGNERTQVAYRSIRAAAEGEVPEAQ